MQALSSIRYAGAALLMAAAAVIATPASAQRGYDFDNNASPLPNACSLGAACVGYDLPPVLNNNGEPFYGSSSNGISSVRYFGNQQVFFYKEGVVSFGAALPDTASIAGGLASLGTGTWFAPSFGTASTLFAFNNGFGKIRANWGTDVDDPDFQFVIQGTFINDTPIVEFRYRGAVFPLGLVTGYSYSPFSGGFSGANPSTADNIDLRYGGSQGGGAAVPEPGIWALFIMSFGLVGATLRGRRGARLIVG